MKIILSVEDMRKSDAATIRTSVGSRELMYRAGEAIVKAADVRGKTAIICGSGNNAGDGYVAALVLNEQGIHPDIFLLSDRFSDDGRYYFDQCVKKGIKVNKLSEDTDLTSYDTVFDCILGTGFKGDVRDEVRQAIEKINSSGAYVVSADINSGLNGDNGQAECCVHSDLTVSVGFYQPGHFLGKAKDVMKKKTVCDIGIKPEGNSFRLLEAEDTKVLFASRKNYSNKGTYGYTALIGGSEKYSGAAKLAGMAASALRAGTGVVKLAVPDSLKASVLPYMLESTLYPLKDADGNFVFDEHEIESLITHTAAVGVGMGLGNTHETVKLITYLLKEYKGRLVIDADGLNALSGLDASLLKESEADIVLTPHVKEFSRLSGQPLEEILKDPINSAVAYAGKNNCIVLLKGPSTIITDGESVYLTGTGSAGMATAGSGDVLTGIMTALQGYIKQDTLFTAAAAAWLNGRAGELAGEKAGAVSQMAGDTASMIPQAVKEVVNDDAIMFDMKAVFCKQIAADFAASSDDVCSKQNVFTVYRPCDGRRLFDSDSDDCYLKAVCVHGKIMMTGREDVIAWCREKFAERTSDWFMEYPTLRMIDERCREDGFMLKQAHPFYLPEGISDEPEVTGDIVWYDEEEIFRFEGDKRFTNAYSFRKAAKDMIGVGLIRNGEILGMAGASADSPDMWQIGIDVVAGARGEHIGTALVTRLKNRILRQGKLPFYGTGMSHIHSQNVAAHSGFYPAWTEFYTVPCNPLPTGGLS